MRTIYTEIEIAASPQCVWDVLADFAGYGSWNPSIERLEGGQSPGDRLLLHARMPRLGRVKLQARLRRFEPRCELSWHGELISPPVFAGEHSFNLEPLSGGRTRLVQKEEFRGLLAPLFVMAFASGLAAFYSEANRGLKALVEESPKVQRSKGPRVSPAFGPLER